MYRAGNSVEQVFGGTVIKQGDRTPLGFNFRTENGELVDLTGSTVQVKVASDKGVVLEKQATISDEYTAQFTIGSQDITGAGDMRIEFIVTYPAGTIEKFPSDDWQRVRITPTLEDVEKYGVGYITFEKLTGEFQNQFDEFTGGVDQQIDYQKQRVDNLIKNTPQPSEVIDIRYDSEGVTHETASARLESDYNKVTTQLAKIATYKEINATLPFGTTLTALKGNGTNETSALLALLNYVADNHLTLYIPKNVTILVDIMTITSKSNFGIRCEGTIKRLNSSPTVGSLLRFNSCTNVTIHEANFDGNALNNGCQEGVAYTSSQEQKHTLTFMDSNNVSIDKFYVLNPCGDGIYINNTSNVKMGTITGKADQRIGRNLVSIISGQDFFIDYLFCDGIGHYDMPGGLDIEPNASTEVIRNVFVNNVDIRSGGANPFSILAAQGSTVENIFVDKAKVTSLASTNVQCALITASDVFINSLKVDGNNGIANGLKIDQTITPVKNVFVKKVSGKNCYRGMEVGFQGQIDTLEVNGTFRNCTFDGVTLFGCKNSKFVLDIDSVGSARYVINFAPTTSIDNVLISGNLTKRGTGIKCLGTSATSDKINNVILENLDFTGWANDDRLFGAGFQGTVTKRNCPNLTLAATIPSGTLTQWKQGDIVWNIGTDPTVAFWRRLTNGTANVLNTDWKAY
ncbi:hypothetical protein ACBZ92_02170 [Priestia aryabhattai]|uniref:hypothetical protein n=1 Tax=Priestia aryabhattai TaxID=412384 RepID=UPI003568E697